MSFRKRKLYDSHILIVVHFSGFSMVHILLLVDHCASGNIPCVEEWII